MSYVIFPLLFILAFAGMELVAWGTHKFVMHGFLWSLHKSHHQKTKGFFEWNDLFFLFFGLIGAGLIITGIADFDGKLFVGAGITAYGLVYISVHDIFIHRRLKLFRNVNWAYLEALRKAHKAHHQKTEKEGAVSFGLLLVPYKFVREVQDRRSGNVR